MSTKTPSQVKAELAHSGISVAQWATANSLNVMIVYGVLSGRRKGSRGEAHRAAILLGLKEGEIVQPNQVKDALALNAKRIAA